MCLTFFIRGYPLDHGGHNELSTQKYIHRHYDKYQYREDTDDGDEDPSFTREHRRYQYCKKKKRAETTTTECEGMLVFLCNIDTQERDHTGDDSYFVIVIFYMDSCCIIREEMIDRDTSGVLG